MQAPRPNAWRLHGALCWFATWSQFWLIGWFVKTFLCLTNLGRA